MPYKDIERRREYGRRRYHELKGGEKKQRTFTPEQRERKRQYMREYRARHPEIRAAWLAEHQEYMRDYEREARVRRGPEYNRRAWERNPKVSINGVRVTVASMPPEWRPVLLAIREARQLLSRKGPKPNGN